MTKETVEGIDAYCVKCKEKVQIANGRIKVSDSGRRMAQGDCDRCGTKVNRILGKADDSPSLIQAVAEKIRSSQWVYIQDPGLVEADDEGSDGCDCGECSCGGNDADPYEYEADSEDELRDAGWMTTDEFLGALVPGLREYLNHNWGVTGPDDLHHPEDLFANAAVYLEVAMHVAGDFGVQPRG